MEKSESLKQNRFEFFMLNEFSSQIFWDKIKSLIHNRLENSIRIILEEVEVLDVNDSNRLFYENDKVLETENYKVFWKIEFEIPTLNDLNSQELNDLSIITSKLIPLKITTEDLISFYEKNPIKVSPKSLEFIAELLEENKTLQDKLNPTTKDLIYRQSLIKMIADTNEKQEIDSLELEPSYVDFDKFLKSLEQQEISEVDSLGEGRCCWNCPNCDCGEESCESETIKNEDSEVIYDITTNKSFYKYSLEKTEQKLKELVDKSKKTKGTLKIGYAYPQYEYPKGEWIKNGTKKIKGEKIYVKKFIPYHFERKKTNPAIVYLVALDLNRNIKRWLNLSKIRFEN